MLFVTILFVHCFDIKSNQAKHNTTTLDYICRWWCDHPNLLFGKVQIWSCEKIIQVLTALVVSSSWSIDRESKSNQTSDMAWWGTKLRAKPFEPPPYCNCKGITPHPRFCMEDKYYSELLRNCCMSMNNCIIGPLFYWELWSKTRHSCWRGASKIVQAIISIILWWFYLV